MDLNPVIAALFCNDRRYTELLNNALDLLGRELSAFNARVPSVADRARSNEFAIMDHRRHGAAAETGCELNENLAVKGVNAVGDLASRLYIFARTYRRAREGARTVNFDVVIDPVCAGDYQSDTAGGTANKVIDCIGLVGSVLVVMCYRSHGRHKIAVFDLRIAD